MTKGYAAFLARPIQTQVIGVYGRLHGLNEYIRVLKERQEEPSSAVADLSAERRVADLGTSIRALHSLLDEQYPRIAENFQQA